MSTLLDFSSFEYFCLISINIYYPRNYAKFDNNAWIDSFSLNTQCRPNNSDRLNTRLVQAKFNTGHSNISLFAKINFDFCLSEWRSDNFIIGLTNVSPTVTAPTLWNYAVCGQYPGSVGAGAQVTVKCACGLTAYRYVIVQFPTIDYANFCELDVYIRRKFISIAENMRFWSPTKKFE